jgi:hypothetical protein
MGREVCAGFLKKQGGSVRTWKRRWFVLDTSDQLKYFKSKVSWGREGPTAPRNWGVESICEKVSRWMPLRSTPHRTSALLRLTEEIFMVLCLR